MVLVGFKPDIWQPTGFLQCFDTVGLVIRPLKIVPEMTYYVSSGTLNPTHSLTHLTAHGMLVRQRESGARIMSYHIICEFIVCLLHNRTKVQYKCLWLEDYRRVIDRTTQTSSRLTSYLTTFDATNSGSDENATLLGQSVTVAVKHTPARHRR